jgi:pyruvate/2-oxoglutarate dehydrogenase complex dihydrolipoamide acyltransferase (E2) component
MKVEVKMPDLATTGGELKIVKWLVEVGQPVERGQALLEVETDKAAVEVEAFTAGTLVETHVNVDDLVSVGDVIAMIETA